MALYSHVSTGWESLDIIIDHLRPGAQPSVVQGHGLLVVGVQGLPPEVEGIAGAHIMAIEWEKMVPVIAEKAGLLPRPDISVPKA
mgnify:CR=1 FL=1